MILNESIMSLLLVYNDESIMSLLLVYNESIMSLKVVGSIAMSLIASKLKPLIGYAWLWFIVAACVMISNIQNSVASNLSELHHQIVPSLGFILNTFITKTKYGRMRSATATTPETKIVPTTTTTDHMAYDSDSENQLPASYKFWLWFYLSKINDGYYLVKNHRIFGTWIGTQTSTITDPDFRSQKDTDFGAELETMELQETIELPYSRNFFGVWNFSNLFYKIDASFMQTAKIVTFFIPHHIFLIRQKFGWMIIVKINQIKFHIALFAQR